MRGSARPLPDASKSGAWSLLGLGLGLLVTAAILLFISLGPRSGTIATVIFIYIFLFLGGGAIAALAIHRWLSRQERKEGGASWP